MGAKADRRPYEDKIIYHDRRREYATDDWGEEAGYQGMPAIQAIRNRQVWSGNFLTVHVDILRTVHSIRAERRA